MIKNSQIDKASKNNQSDDEQDCVYCNGMSLLWWLTTSDDIVTYEECVSPALYRSIWGRVYCLVNLVSRHRTQIDGLQIAFTETNEELSDLRTGTSLACVIEIVNTLKNAPHKQQPGYANDTAQAHNERTDSLRKYSRSKTSTSEAHPVTSHATWRHYSRCGKT